MADGTKSGLASGTNGSPQLMLDNDELTAKAKEMKLMFKEHIRAVEHIRSMLI